MKKINFLRRVFDKRLHTVIFFVTSRCNARCVGCFNWKNLNRKDDLSFSEIEKVSRSMPNFKHILFSGGEPYLRNDLPKICKTFRAQNKIRSVSLPTNGLLPIVIQKITEKILLENAGLEVNVHFSLDGMEKTHDFLRGVKGNFKKVVESVRRINLLKEKYSALRVTVNTVISNKNFKEISKLVNFVKSLGVDDHTFDLLRGSYQAKTGIGLPSGSEIERLNKLRLATKRYYMKNEGLLRKFFSLSKLNYLIGAQKRVLKNRNLPFECLAGEVSAVIDNNGKVRLCEMLPPVGDLRKEGYDFNRIWESENVRLQKESISGHGCDCTHTCFLSMSIDHAPLIVFIKMPLSYIFGR